MKGAMRFRMMVLGLGVLILSVGCRSGAVKRETASSPSTASPVSSQPMDATFVCVGVPSARLELRKDGTFALQEPGFVVAGKYTINGSMLMLHPDGELETIGMQFEGNRLLDPHGSPWVRQ